MRTGTIYGLCEPDGTLRYVGRTMRSPAVRRNEHIRESVQRERNCPVHEWIRGLIDAGTGPALWVLEEDVPLADLDQRERDWIAALRSWGLDALNAFSGGNGGRPLRRSEKDRLSVEATRRRRDEMGRFA